MPADLLGPDLRAARLECPHNGYAVLIAGQQDVHSVARHKLKVARGHDMLAHGSQRGTIRGALPGIGQA
jgi:hypothetical protein